jgi:ureidoacrylate peracid hydrolase
MTDIDEILTQATYRRGGARVYGMPDWTRTSVLVCNMQKCWTLPDQPFHRLLPGQDDAFFGEVAGFAATARARGAQVVWLRTVTGPVGAADYWATYLDNFVGAENRGPAVEALLPGTTSQSLDERMDVAEGDWVIDKPRFDAFLKTGLDDRLRAAGIDGTVVIGTATNICCESTVRSAMGRDFATWMPHDLVSAPTVDGHLAGLRSVAQSFAEISPAASLLAG